MYPGFSPTKINLRDIVVQSVFLSVVTWVLISAVVSTRTNLEILGIGSGFDFLDRSTGWSYSFSLIGQSIDDLYSRTLFIGFLNTLFVGSLSIVLATLLGFAIGTARDGSNIALKGFAAAYIQLFRNIPLILQAVFWYAVLIHMPGPRNAISFLDILFISNRGIMVPWVNLPAFAIVGWLVITGVSGFLILRLKAYAWHMRLGAWILLNVMIAYIAFLIFSDKDSFFSIPYLKGLRFREGLPIPVELVTMMIAIVLYGTAYIAEVVRGGLEEVPKGLIEAGQALSLPNHTIWFRIKLPIALSTIIPPLGNQWIFLMKATTVGVAIGFSDLFMIISTSITQSGQTLELIGLLMASFLLINYCLAQLINLINRQFQLPGR